MKKLIGIALVLALAVTLCLSTVALAAPDEEVRTDWSFTGPGEITIHTEKAGDLGSSSHLYVETSGSGSSGWETAQLYPSGAWGIFEVNRYATVENGTIAASFVQDCTITYWTAYTEYGALLTGGGADPDDPNTWGGGSGSIGQSYRSDTYGANFESHTVADCPYTVMTGEESTSGGYYWNFGIGATGDGVATLDVNLSDHVAHGGDPNYPKMWGSFSVNADQTDAGFGASWSTLADFNGTTWTPSITEGFDVDVNSSGRYSEDASASWVTIAGYITGMK